MRKNQTRGSGNWCPAGGSGCKYVREDPMSKKEGGDGLVCTREKLFLNEAKGWQGKGIQGFK